MVSTYTNMITKETQELRDFYKDRDVYINSVRELLELSQPKLDETIEIENFVSNDPRTLWNMGTFLLQPRPMTNAVTDIDGRELLGDIRAAAETIEQLLNRQWRDLNEHHMRKGSSGFYWEMVGALCATGWYSVPYGISADSLFLSHWNPMSVYPEWSDDESVGLQRLARIREISSTEAKKIADREGWFWIERSKNSTIIEHRLWKKIEGRVYYGVSFNNDVVRELSLVRGIYDIPVVAGGVGATPVLNGESYFYNSRGRPQMGASILDTNREVYTQFNRTLSFLQQLLHDTAFPKTYERGEGVSADNPIVRSREEFYKRGAHYAVPPDGEIGVIAMPPIPAEAQTQLLSYRNMIQRGGFSDTVFGNLLGQTSAIVISQAAEAAQQILIPYHQAVEYVCSEISRYWIDTMLKRPGRYKFISRLERLALETFRNENVEYLIRSNYSVQVPGDTAARILMAKQASPTWELSPETSMRMFLPEIVDPQLELAKVRAERARNHPIFETVRVANALQTSADELAEGNPELAQIMLQAAETILASIGAAQQGPADGSSPQGAQPASAGAAPGAPEGQAGLPSSSASSGLNSLFSGGQNGSTPAN